MLVACLVADFARSDASAADAPTKAFFAEHCIRCHGEKQQ